MSAQTMSRTGSETSRSQPSTSGDRRGNPIFEFVGTHITGLAAISVVLAVVKAQRVGRDMGGEGVDRVG